MRTLKTFLFISLVFGVLFYFAIPSGEDSRVATAVFTGLILGALFGGYSFLVHRPCVRKVEYVYTPYKWTRHWLVQTGPAVTRTVVEVIPPDLPEPTKWSLG
jgi:hypothetical protein